MVNNLTVAWATPVDPVELGASIEAHALVKATMSAFDDFIEDTPQESAAKQLAPELLNIISTNVRQSAFEEYRKEWGKFWMCYHAWCRPRDHLSEKEYDAIRTSFLTERSDVIAEGGSDFDVDDYFHDWLSGYQSRTFSDIDRHSDNIDTLERKIRESSDREDDTRFLDARKMFSEEFGLEIHFQVYRREADYDDSWFGEMNDLGVRTLMAYLILPAEYGVMNRSTLPRSTSFHATMLIDPSIRQAPSDDQRALFKTAMAKLNLRANPDPYLACADHYWPWTRRRSTSERYRKTRKELATIEKKGEDDDHPYDEEFGETFGEWRRKLNATEWPQFMVFVSETHDTQNRYGTTGWGSPSSTDME